ncbi:hypothetical protein G7Z17_g3231 [Cylindrodendrum hubeiense]|uniref:Uncharacterized protein n=1 Tax=Cylindrodendrum hubeiense TaxID=595255 RepID=A0A9P5HHA3_9HYPO|nr:hypothetical protein G7Z17_g3231 [Cylindrodendrum hubeiense]
MPLNSTTFTKPYGTDISSSGIGSSPRATIGTTQTTSFPSGLITGPSFSASSTPRYPVGNSTSSGTPWHTGATSTAFNRTLPTGPGTSRMSGGSVPTLSITTSSPIWTNTTSATSGPSETAGLPGSASQPLPSKPVGNTTGAGINSTIVRAEQRESGMEYDKHLLIHWYSPEHNHVHDRIAVIDMFGFGSTGYTLLTTLETVTRSDEEWDSGKPMYPVPTGKKSSEDKLPNNPNYPWGGDSPIHRHQNTTRLGDGTRDGDLLPRSEWRRRWETIVRKLKAVWQQQRPEINDHGA